MLSLGNQLKPAEIFHKARGGGVSACYSLPFDIIVSKS